jgi:hypothetical protein
VTPTDRERLTLRRRHREMLVVTCAVVVLAFVLNVRTDGRVTPAGLTDWPLPPACMSQELFGKKCPGCGLTRSFVLLAHGDWHGAWGYHRLGWLMAAAVLIQAPYRITALRRPDLQPLGTWVPKAFGYLLIAALIGNWLVEVLTK